MSKSFKKFPKCGYTTAKSEKQDKRFANRKLRTLTKILLKQNREILPILKDVSNPWNMAKDGKQIVDPIKFPEILRK